MKKSFVKIDAKENAVISFLTKRKFLSSLILCLIFFLIFFSLNRFQFYTGGDDDGIIRLISNGETAISFVGYFFAWLVSVIQPIFPHLNFYYIFQDIICFFSLVIINYLFLCKLGVKKGLFFSVFFDILFFSIYIIVIHFTNTAVVACTAGIICIIYGCMFEKRKRYKRLQLFGGSFLALVGSQVRYTPFISVCIIVAVCGFGAFLSSFFKFKKHNKFKQAFSKSLKKYLKTAVAIVAVTALIFGVNKASDVLKTTSPDYKDFYEYNSELSRVNDYRIADFFANKDFYRSIGINSFYETNVLKQWCVDDDFFTKEKLKAIADYSEIHAADGIGSRSSPHALFSIIGNALSERAKNGFLLIEALIIVVVFFVLLILWLLAKEKIKAVLSALIFAVLWGVILTYTGGPFEGADNCNLLLLPLAVFTIIIGALYNRYQQIINLCISFAVAVLYIYLALSRIHFSAALCFYLPSFVLLIITLDENNLRSFKFKKHPTLLRRIFAVILILVSISTSALLFIKYSHIEYPNDYKQVKEYIQKHPNNLFLLDGKFMSDSNFNVFVKTEPLKNTITYGGWDKHSRTYKESMEKNGIEHLFSESIDSNIIIVLFNYSKKPESMQVKRGNLDGYYNIRYAPAGKYLTFEKIKSFPSYDMYRIVSHKSNNNE